MKYFETLVSTHYNIDRENKILYQTISFQGGEKYLHDPSFIIHKKIENKIIESNIANNMTIFFKDMERKDSEVIIHYKITEEFNFELLKPSYQKITAQLPETKGCLNCQYKVLDNKVNYCSFQNNMVLVNFRKNCRYFSQKI